MLSFNQLGNLGRLGNQMFQYAALKGISSNRGYEYCIPPKESFGIDDEKVRKTDCNLYDVFDISSRNIIRISSNQRIMERKHEFDKNLFDNCPDRADLFGYFQSEKYFKHIENEIRNDFMFNKYLIDKCKEIIGNKKYIALHIRRGDYLIKPDYHPIQTIEYYEKSLEFFPNNIPVIIFSDDHDWCKNQELFSSDRFLISENNTTDADLCMMSHCKYHIIANSSFSWWGAWLAKSEQVIAPKNWFGRDCGSKSVKDMEFDNWRWL